MSHTRDAPKRGECPHCLKKGLGVPRHWLLPCDEGRVVWRRTCQYCLATVEVPAPTRRRPA